MMPQNILDNLSSHLKNVIASAISLATSMQHAKVDTFHLLFAMLHEKGAIGAELLNKLEIQEDDLEPILLKMEQQTGKKNTSKEAITAVVPELNEQARKALEKAMVLAYEYSHSYVGTEHLLHGIIQVPDKRLTTLLKKRKLTKTDILSQIDIILDGTSKFPDVDDVAAVMDEIQDLTSQLPEQSAAPQMKKLKRKKGKKKGSTPALDMFTVELTDKKQQKHIDPVIGREREINRVIHILSRRTKNNPVLIGEPGVGKTAIVEGLAKRIAEGNVPDALKHQKIYALDLALLISGTIYRGEFESRIKQLIDDVGRMPNAILFIDELHNIIGAGSNQGTMDAANILKPALARGKLRCIGATTLDEYNKYIAADPALERRFQSIQVEEPDTATAFKILQGIAKYYERFHNVQFSTEALETAVELSSKYIHDNQLPDKAIDLIDEAAAKVKIQQPLSKDERRINELKEEIKTCQKEKEDAILSEKFKHAISLKEKEETLQKELQECKKQLKSQTKTKAPVSKEDIAAIMETKLHIGADTLLKDEWQQLDALPKHLKKEVFGQEHVITRVSKALKYAHLRINKTRPLASFLFAGPSGVGKTKLAKQIAKELYHDEKALIKFDMSEFKEGHSVSKLLGSPAGYVGHKERNIFTEQLKKRPYAVIVFDEIDKAHTDVLRLLYQILDEGTLTDSSGKKIHFNHSIIIMTTNVGSSLYKSHGIGFSQSSSAKAHISKEKERHIYAHFKEMFDAALLGRIDSVCLFSPLSSDALTQIVQHQIDQMNEHFKQTVDISIHSQKSTLEKIAKSVYNQDTGARNVEQHLAEIINDLILDVLKKESKKKQYTLKEKNGSYSLS